MSETRTDGDPFSTTGDFGQEGSDLIGRGHFNDNLSTLKPIVEFY
jgi:hypothetical protein